MELEVLRTYYPEGTNGILKLNGVEQCYTIELPWQNNLARHSCIPEGRYRLKRRYSHKFKEHLEVVGVENRWLILIHPANDALKELYGCIAPVSVLTGPGRGNMSRVAFEWIKALVIPALKKETVFIHFKSLKNDVERKSEIAHAKIL